MAFVIIGWSCDTQGLRREVLGYDGIYVAESKSSFGNEIGALDLATMAAEQLAEWLPSKNSNISATMTRHRAK